MDFFNSWLQGIIIAVIISTIIEMILPNGNSKKYVKIVLGIYVVFTIITPVVNQFFTSDFDLASIFKLEEYVKEMETYETNAKNIDPNKANEENIKQIYLSNLKKDMKAKLEEKNYLAKQIEIEIKEEGSYQVNKISLSLEKKEEEQVSSKEKINEIKKVEIQISEKKEEERESKSPITEQEKEEIKKYLSSVYEVKEKQIIIY